MAAMIRMSMRCVPVPPTRSTARSWIARSSFACADERQIGHFVEKQRAAVGVLELAAPAADAGRRAVFDAEQLRLEQRFDERRAIDGDERTVPPAAQLVNLAGDQLLADTALPFQRAR